MAPPACFVPEGSLCGPLRNVNGLLAPDDSLLVLRTDPPVPGTGLLALVNNLPVLGNGARLCSRQNSMYKRDPAIYSWRCKI